MSVTEIKAQASNLSFEELSDLARHVRALTAPDKGANDLHAYRDRFRRLEEDRGQEGTVFRESILPRGPTRIGLVAWSEFFPIRREAKFARKWLMTTHLLEQLAGGNPANRREVGIEQGGMAAKHADLLLDAFDGRAPIAHVQCAVKGQRLRVGSQRAGERGGTLRLFESSVTLK